MPRRSTHAGDLRPRRTPRRIFRWLARFLGWSATVAVVGLLVALVVALLVYVNRARIVNEALARLVEPFEVTVGKINLRTPGLVRIEDLTLSPKRGHSGEPALTVPEAVLSYRFNDLRNRRQLGEIVLRRPRLVIDGQMLDAMRTGEPDPSVSVSRPDLSAFYYYTESIVVEEGELQIDLDPGSKIEANWQLVIPPLQFDEGGKLSRPVELGLDNLTLVPGGSESEAATVGQIEARFHLRQDLSVVDIESLRLSGVDAAITPAWFGGGASAAGATPEPAPADADRAPSSDPSTDPAASGPTGSDAASDSVEWRIREFEVGQSAFSLTGFDGIAPGPVIPDIALDAALRLTGIRFAGGRWSSEDPVAFELENVAIGPPETQLAGADRVVLEADSLGDLLHGRTAGRIEIRGLDVVMTDETLERCRASREGESGVEDPEPEPRTEETPLPWVVRQLVVDEGNFVMGDVAFGGKTQPRIETKVAGTLHDLRFGGGEGFASEGDQYVLLERSRVRAPGVASAGRAILALRRAELAGNWERFRAGKEVERLLIDGMEIHFSDESLGRWLTPEETEPVTPVGGVIEPREVYRIANLEVNEGTLVADSSFGEELVPKIYSDFVVRTDASPGVEPFAYQLVFENFRLRNHPVFLADPVDVRAPTLFPDGRVGPVPSGADPVAEEEVITIERIEVSATADQLQRQRRVESVQVVGAVLNVGEGLKRIVDAPGDRAEETPPEAPPVDPAPRGEAPALPAWILNEVGITRSQVRFEKLIPQVEGLEFDIETTLFEVPLSPDGLLAQDKMQKVELAGIEIKDPYDSFITVAQLPTIFVEFSLAGLAAQEIEKIDLIAPALHVGQGLFWWIDYQRNFRAVNEGASVGLNEPAPERISPDWVIKTINATAGKIVVAPAGIPIGMVPFPFNATTNMGEGRIELVLNIPDEDYVYRFPDYKVDLYGLTGDVQFNVPVEQESNNLVQTFSLDRIVWKDYEAANLYLTVTFDAEGVYGALGGEAYGGYAEGQFNFYLDDRGKWDAWIAGTGMDTGPITEIIVPDNFLMEGKVSLKLVAEGRDRIPGETTGEFQTLGPGWFDVTKLEGILDELPEEWNSLQRSLTELSLIALKRFDYDEGAGSLSLHGREGDLHLLFVGPHGTRALDLKLHDQRNTTAQTTTEPNRTPLPEAAARPVSRDP